VDQVPTCLQIPFKQSAQILPANGLNYVTIASAGTTNTNLAPTKIVGVTACNNDTVSHDLQVAINDPGTGLTVVLGTVTLPINAGFVGTVPTVSLLNSIPALPLDETSQAYLFLNPDDILQVRCSVAAVSAGHSIDLIAFGADF
jgi:hypothetical protein